MKGVCFPTTTDTQIVLTQYEGNSEGGNLTHPQHVEEHNENRPGWSEGHSNAEDADKHHATKENRLPAEPGKSTQQSTTIKVFKKSEEYGNQGKMKRSSKQ